VKAKKTILLVEDDEDQAMLAVRALRKHGIAGEADGVVVARTGEEALEHLLGTGARGAGRPGRETPAFVLLDKDLPGTDGLGVLRRMRSDGRTRLVSVVLFSSSGGPEEDAEGYRLGANSYVTKPARYEEFCEALGCLGCRHEIWSVDVRYVDHQLPDTGNVYSVTILENHSRCILASALSTSQDLTAYLSVLYTAIERYGAPEMLVSDGAGIFRASQANAIYRTLKIKKETIEKRQPWQNFAETTFAIQWRMGDYYFEKAERWEGLVAAHDRWVEQYNTQKHQAHDHRKDGRHSPAEVLGFLTSIRHLPEDLRRAFFEIRFTRVLDASGYARLKHWRIYAEEGLARREVTLWLGADALAVEFAGDTLARYEVECSSAKGNAAGKLREVKRPQLYGHPYLLRQLRLFELDDVLGDDWLKVLKVSEYAHRRPRRPQILQEALFAY